jgi:myo-inositol-1(or 4)-monophosphatase
VSDSDWRSRLVSLLEPVGSRVVEAYGRTGPLHYKVGREAVTHVDAEIERFLAARIRSDFPDHAVVGEEHGRSGPDGAEFEWHVDPVDGTLNYALGLPVFSVSVAVVRAGAIEAGAVVDPLRGDLYVAARGEGAWRGDERLAVSARSTLREAIASFQSSRKGRFVRDAAILQRVFTSISKVRRLGSVALELAFVADGRLDLLLGSKRRAQNLYDVAAGVLLVEEAGGRVTDGRGRPFRAGANEIVASNGHLHEAALELVRPAEGAGA